MTTRHNKSIISRRGFVASLGSAAVFALLPRTALADSGPNATSDAISYSEGLLGTDSAGNILVIESGAITSIQVTENSSTRIVAATDLSTGKTYEAILDKTRGILHSPYTGANIDISSFHSSNSTEYSIEPKLNAPARTYERFEFSWSSIFNFAGIAATVADIVMLVVSVIGKVNIPESARNTIDLILDGMGRIIPNDPNHGIYVVMVLLEWYENGKLVKAEYNFDEIGTY